MAKVIQMNLFGDILDIDNSSSNKEKDYGILVSDGKRTLEEISSNILPEIGEGGAAGSTPLGSSKEHSGNGGRIDGEWTSEGRSYGDSSPSIHSSNTGERSDREEIAQLDHLLPRSSGKLRNGHTDDRGNYRITDEDPIGSGGKVSKFDANLEAIRILKMLDDEKRFATPDEQSKLVLYTGWGGLSEVFKNDLDGAWLSRQNKLKEYLTEQEYLSVSRSTINAHYTSPEIIKFIWTEVERMGYNGGPTLEPASGTGLFFGMRPVHLPVEMHGIELDIISGRIAQQLYQSADIKINGYENIRMPENKYNLIIGNVPFGDIKPYEEKRYQTPGLENRYSIHDFYFLKSLYGTKTGGLIAFVTSRYTLDKLDTEVREKIADSADFLGAVRLPNNAFSKIANTEVVTDIVFLQKRSIEVPMSELTKNFINTSILSLKSPDGITSDVTINKYFIDNPDMIAGSQELTGSMYSGNEYTVTLPEDKLKDRLNSLIKKFPENIMSIIIDNNSNNLDESLNGIFSKINLDNIPIGSFIVGNDNKLYIKNYPACEIQPSSLYVNEKDNSDDINRIMQMSAIRDAVKSAIDHYYNNQQLDVTRDLARLNSLYDSFVNANGPLNSKKNVFLFFNDPDSSLLQSLEIWNPKTKVAKKSDIFEGINFTRKQSPTHVDKPVDAMALSLSKYGSLNISYMESLIGKDRSIFINDLISSGHIYLDPSDYLHNGKTTYITGDEYLSGNVRNKLNDSKLAAKKYPSLFSKNVEDLNNILPPEIPAQDISIRLNSPIVGDRYVKQFVRDLLNVYDVKVIHVPLTGKWEIQCRSHSTENTETFGTPRMFAVDIINNIMNGKPLKVYHTTENTIDQEATSAAELKAESINNEFQKWIWRDKDRTDDIVSRYNDVFNSHVERKFIHPERLQNPNADIRFHGCNLPFPMRPHQADAVWRNLQSKNTMFSHSVGAGKTYEIACSAMELRRLGLRHKPMIVCPDHMIGQWSSEFRQAYPSAKLLIADDHNWNKDNRRAFVNKIAFGDWDAILIRSESFKMIPMSDSFKKEFFEKKIQEYNDYIKSCDYDKSKPRSIKDLEKSVLKYKDKIKELTDIHRDEGVIPFDQLGVDHLFVDEADIYKNLEYYTQLQNVRGLGSPDGSERALDMYMKIRYIQDNRWRYYFCDRYTNQ